MLDDASKIVVEPISEDDVCGEALDYDLEFMDLEILARGRPERQTGDSISPAEAPDWAAVRDLALQLAARAHDLRLELYIARAQLSLVGPAPVAVRLHRMATLIATYWEKLHPAPEDEDDDYTVRLNALAEMANPEGLLGDLRNMPMVSSRRSGSFSYRDWHSARYDENPAHHSDQIVAALAETDSAEHDKMFAALSSCAQALDRIDAATRDNVASHEMPKLTPVSALLQQMVEVLRPYISAPAEPEPEAGAEAGADADAPRVVVPGGMRGGPNSRDDIIEMLDRICRWYRLNEPASPVPALLERARKLVSQDFLALLRELAPEGEKQFRFLAGLPGEPDDD